MSVFSDEHFDAAERATARRQIHDALLSYCRGIDRLRPELVSAAFHAGALLHDYGPEPLPIEQFAHGATASLEAKFAATQHRISNINIQFDNDSESAPGVSNGAMVESYILAYHWEDSPEGARLHTFNGRYIDRFAERDGRWRVSERWLRVDWTRVERIEATMGERWLPSGRGNAPDPLWTGSTAATHG